MRKLMLVVAVVAAVPALGAQDGWINLFNGRDLTGWTAKGGKARYSVAEGCILGEAAPNTVNSFLCTEKEYADFILELDFKVDPRLNSGVQIRSECFDRPTQVEWQGRNINIPAGRVHGYQVEIDPDPARDRWWTGGIYDEGRRNWMCPGPFGGETNEFRRLGKAVFKTNDWNRLRVEAVGSSIKTCLNGVLRAEITDSLTSKGFIGLQVHEIPNRAEMAGAPVRFRNIRLLPVSSSGARTEPALNVLTEQEKSEGWRLLWDGKTTAGWRSATAEAFPTGGWEIKDGALTVLESGGGESVSGGDIITRERFSDFELLVDFKITPGANSGIKYFVQPNLGAVTGAGAKAATGSAIGLEFQILDDERHPDAKLGRDGNRTLASLYDLVPAASTKQARPIGEWNTARILVKGNHVEHWLNGGKAAEYERGSAPFRELVAASKYRNIPGFGEWPDGHLLLQDHGNRVSFRNLKIRVPSAK